MASDVTLLPWVADSATSPPATLSSAATSAPAVTMPVRAVKEVRRSEFAITIWVRRLFAFVATLSRSKVMSASPVLTLSPTETLAVKPSPRIWTVSRPMCSSTSSPSVVRIVTAWCDG